MSLQQTLILGFIAGVTILIGMPVGRVRHLSPWWRVFLNAISIGVLLFLTWDVLSAAWEPIDAALVGVYEGTGGYAPAFGYGLLFIGGLSAGLLSLVAYEGWMARSASSASDTAPRVGPGAMAKAELSQRESRLHSWSPARRLSLLIAVGIGLHNFAEGLAIGQSAASGAVALATLLVIGFALHNATEGFGIVAPLAGDVDESGKPRVPSWGFLLAMAAIAGGPTFVGTAVGFNFTSEPVSVIFLSLAAGSIIYVIMQLIGVAVKSGQRYALAYGVLVGLIAGFATDAIVIAAGI